MSDAAPLPDPEAMVVYLLLLDRDGRRTLVREGSGLAPSLRTAPVFYPEVEELVGRAREEFGLEVAILRCLEEGDANEGRPRLYSAVRVSEDDRPRAGFGWAALDELKFGEDATERLIRMARMEVERLSSSTPPESPVPWDSPTPWHRRAREWVEANVPPTADGSAWRMAQIRSWSISSVWRLTSGGERLYFKASPRYFASEVAVTRDVASRFPEVSPGLVAVEPDEGWMIMEDLGDVTLSKTDSAELWRETMRTIARVQQGYAGRPAALEAMNLERRTLRDIVESLAYWLEDPSCSGLRMFQSENDAALARLRPSLDEVSAMARQLDGLGLPPTLEHGDLDADERVHPGRRAGSDGLVGRLRIASVLHAADAGAGASLSAVRGSLPAGVGGPWFAGWPATGVRGRQGRWRRWSRRSTTIGTSFHTCPTRILISGRWRGISPRCWIWRRRRWGICKGAE